MKKQAIYLALLAAIGLSACASKPAPTPAPAVEKPAAQKIEPVAAQVTVFTATVDSVDLKNRTVVLKDAQGNTAPMKVAKSVANLQNVQKGDVFVIEYAQAVAVSRLKHRRAQLLAFLNRTASLLLARSLTLSHLLKKQIRSTLLPRS